MTNRLRPSLARLIPVLLAAAAGPAMAGPVSSPFVEQSWAPHGATAQARYGGVVAPAGDVNGDGYSDVLVSAPKDEGPAADAGKVFLYLGSKTGLAASPAWSFSANQAGAATGGAAAAAGDVNGDGFDDVVIGTPQWATSGPVVAMAGKISIFHGSPAGLPASPTYERLAPTPTANARFGFSVATAGSVNGDPYDDIIVGAPFHTSGGLTGRGAAFVYHGGATGLAAAPALTILGAQAGANLGKAVSTAGDVDGDGYSDAIVGAPFATFMGNQSGTASLFRGSAGGLLAVADTVLGGDRDRQEVGGAVANAGDVNGDGYADVLVGLPGDDNGGLNVGAYRLFRGGPGGIQAPAVLFVDGNGIEGGRLGASVATLGDLNADGYADFAVGAPADSAEFLEAYVSVYLGGGASLSGPWNLVSSSGQAKNFGVSLATTGDVDGDGFSEFLVGDPAASVVPDAAEGTAALFELARSVPIVMPDWPVDGQAGDLRATALAISPGIELSGFPSLVIGDPGYDYDGTDSGLIYFLDGYKDGARYFPFTTQLGDSSLGRFGNVLADAGDIDRDGFSDVLVSSPTRNGPGGPESGRVYLVRGAQNGELPAVVVRAGDQALARLGSAIAGRGDVDGDGYHDVLIGAARWDGPGLPDCGKVWLYFGGPTGFRPDVWTAEGTVAGQGFGASLSIGDVDADGYGDVLVASVSPLAVAPPSGKVAVFYGKTGGPAALPAWEITSNEPSPTFGAAMSAVGDINADGVTDIVVGAPGEFGTGRIYVFEGGRGSGRPPAPKFLTGTQLGAQFGAEVSGGGDLDGDGIGDFAVGEPHFDGGETEEGRVHVYYGSVTSPIPAWSRESNVPGLELGSSLTSFIDLNNDGFADFAAGGPSPVTLGNGRTYAFAGGGGIGAPCALPLQNPVTSNPHFYPLHIGPAESARVTFPLRSAEGRGRLELQLEVIPTGQPFTAVPTQSSGVQDTGAPTGAGSVLQVPVQLDLQWMGIAYKVRGRSRSTSPFFPGSRWVRPEGHAEGEFDIRRGGAEVAVEGQNAGSTAPRLAGIAPNPVPAAAGGVVRIAFELPRATGVVIDVFDVRGARVRRVMDELRPAGAGSAAWDGADERGVAAPAGLYFVRMQAEGKVDRERMVRLP